MNNDLCLLLGIIIAIGISILINYKLYIYNNDDYRWTGDGKSWDQNNFTSFMTKDFAWFCYQVTFKDNKVYKINSFWAYD